MKKLLLASLVGTIILFAWNFLSWAVLPIHADTFRYAPTQDAVMQSLATLPGTGAYMMPCPDPASANYKAEKQKRMESMASTPSAIIMYTTSNTWMGGGMYGAGILMYFITTLCVASVLRATNGSSFGARWWTAMLFAIVMLLSSQLMELNWMGFPFHFLKGFMIDTVVSWAFCGAWLAWYFGRK